MNRFIILVAATLLALSTLGQVRADDTEIYRSQYTGNANDRPKVLIIFDNSGSMGTIVTASGSKPAYNPAYTYTTISGISADRLYWTTGSTPPSATTSSWFSKSLNRCASSYTPLDNAGLYQDRLMRWLPNKKAKKSKWTTLTSSEHNPPHVDCKLDVDRSNPSNGSGQSNGYPANGTDGPYTATGGASWTSTSYALYSANYMNWYHWNCKTSTQDGKNCASRSRIDVAKEVVTSIIDANPGIDFGLMVFNYNNSTPNGGRVVSRIIPDMSDAQRTSLKNIVNNLVDYTWTPLSETLYEAYRYLAGKSVLYGDDDPSAIPLRDTAAESGGTYISPIGSCQNTYIIYMTDGAPTNDTAADSSIRSLTGKSCYSGKCMPILAGYLHENDLDGDDSNGYQRAITYTIGFQTDQQYLSDTATQGGGKYYTADSAEELAAAFQGAVLSILSTATAFSSPAVATNSFNRTESRDDVLLAMFKPTPGTRWPGNIKKLKLGFINGVATLLDKNGSAALDPASGQIKDTATTYWSSDGDGPKVEAGGVGGRLASRTPASRSLWTNSGKDGALEAFNSSNLDRQAFDFDADDKLFEFFGVTNQTELNTLINWARGQDVEDEDLDGNTNEMRPWPLGDIMHSAPLALNYGGSPDNPDIRLIAGTNEGFLHMFGVDDGEEDWAFFPKELAPVLAQRLEDQDSNDHVYGIDSPVVAYTKDINNDGTLSGSDKAYIYFGLRRGGEILYALDVSTPGTPKFKWKIDRDTSGFDELGQTWSTPRVTSIPGHTGPVLIFGGGYDEGKDDHDLIAKDNLDDKGRAIYIVDAETGALIWSATPTEGSASNRQETGLVHSIAAPVNILDSNGDGKTDRIYAADTGGTLWRIDLPSATKSDWQILKLAYVNGETTISDRRFFNRPDLVRTKKGTTAYDAVLIGSGDRTNPVATDVTDRFYAFRDMQITPYTTAKPADCTNSGDFRCKLPLDEGDLYDATSNYIQQGNTAQAQAAQTALYEKYGWFITLGHAGEKVLGGSITIGGKVFFPTFTPEKANLNVCIPSPGQARLFAVGLQDASAVFDFTQNGTLTLEDRYMEMGAMILDTPSIHIEPGTGKIRLIFPAGGSGGNSNPLDTEEKIKGARGVYWYQEEY
ncbi:MAG: hypothetical protein KJ558_10820 [Gammaproteobacteria bacterium]|nr:hypothetical protein [Gammaproteobacteria bacterium]MBU1655300.1 hypothetical protein [Gammaproteobacteria bacterium]MBU1960770.1 hypothetical protein [Gammaproteobacteria bacterium]